MMNHELLSWLLIGKRGVSTGQPRAHGPYGSPRGPLPLMDPEQKANTHTQLNTHTHIYICVCVYTLYIYVCVCTRRMNADKYAMR